MTFAKDVALKYHIYNSLFLKLPFELVERTGVYLPLLRQHCAKQLSERKRPEEIIDSFFEEQLPKLHEHERRDMLFAFIQYIERQVVLFDATEAGAFDKINALEGAGTLRFLIDKAHHAGKVSELSEKLRDFRLRIVLTAHPTQFYPNSVLLIIGRLSQAIQKNDLQQIDELLCQLAKTPFFSKEKPTPYEEAKSLIWYLKHVLYDAVSNLMISLVDELKLDRYENGLENLISFGFWPGGDRDGNPFVKAETTREVSLALKRALFRKYHADTSALRKKLSFRNVEGPLREIEDKLYIGQFNPEASFQSAEELLSELDGIREHLIEEHSGLFLDKLDAFIMKVKIFGLHFATLDIRQDSSVLQAVAVEVLKNTARNQRRKLQLFLRMRRSNFFLILRQILFLKILKIQNRETSLKYCNLYPGFRKGTGNAAAIASF